MGAQPVWVPETGRVIGNMKHVLDTKGQALEQTPGRPSQRHMGVTAEGAERVRQVRVFVPDGHSSFFLSPPLIPATMAGAAPQAGG